jgi:hypothetical protein
MLQWLASNILMDKTLLFGCQPIELAGMFNKQKRTSLKYYPIGVDK